MTGGLTNGFRGITGLFGFRGTHFLKKQPCPGFLHVPQLALQQSSPAPHVFVPHLIVFGLEIGLLTGGVTGGLGSRSARVVVLPVVEVAFVLFDDAAAITKLLFLLCDNNCNNTITNIIITGGGDLDDGNNNFLYFIVVVLSLMGVLSSTVRYFSLPIRIFKLIIYCFISFMQRYGDSAADNNNQYK